MLVRVKAYGMHPTCKQENDLRAIRREGSDDLIKKLNISYRGREAK